MASKYVQVYTDLKRKIENRELDIGQDLPAEGELTERYQVSRDTVRKALGMLENQGYIQKARGKVATVSGRGAYSFPFEKIASFKELNAHLNRKTRTEVVNLEILSDGNRIMELFEDDEEQEIYDLLRVREIEGERVIIDHDYFRRSIVPNLPLRACRDSVYEYLEKEQGLQIGYATKEIFVQDATEKDRKYLDLGEYGLVVVTKSYTYTKENQLFQYTESRHRPDHFRFVGFAQK